MMMMMMMMMKATTPRPRIFSASWTAPVAPDWDKTSFLLRDGLLWVGLRQGVGTASISSLVRQLYQRKRCSELSGTVGVARQLDRITFDPRVLGSAFPKSFACLSARAWSQASTVQLDGCIPFVCSLFLQSGIGTPLGALTVASPRHSLQRIVCWRLRFLMWFLHNPRCATLLRLFPHVDVHRDQLLHVFLRAVFQDLDFASFQRFHAPVWLFYVLKRHRSTVSNKTCALRFLSCVKCGCVLPSSVQDLSLRSYSC